MAQPKIYRIPDNFIDGGKLFGGLVKTRNFVEGVIFGFITGLIGWNMPVTGTTRISVIIIFLAIGFLPGVMGVNDGPLSTFLAGLFQWFRHKRVMLFNGTAAARTDSITDRMIAAKTSQETLSDAISKFKPANATAGQKTLIEGVDFIFNTDEELSKYLADAENAEKKKGHLPFGR